MEDENDTDTYGDDFSESGHYASVSNDQEDDEQHAQKVNGKVESLEMLLDDLRSELNNEKAEHCKTMILLREANLKAEELSLSRILRDTERKFEKDEEVESKPTTAESPDKDRERIKRNVLKTAENVAEPCFSAFFSSELADFFKFCSTKSIKMGKAVDTKEFDENYCVGALRLVRKGIASHVKKIAEFEKGVGTGVAPPENDMMTRISNLQIELLVAQKAKNDVKVLKMKLMLMVEKMRNEKDLRTRHDEDMQCIKKKLLMLSDHTEKLMNHLKIEATTKLRIVEHLRLTEKSNRKLIEKMSITGKKSSAKDRLILELREGSKILEDQLRLMDEKYLELRTKLDYARESGMKKLQKAERTARELRMKYAMAGGSVVLDRVPLPSIFLNGSADGMLGSSDLQDMAVADMDSGHHQNYITTYNGGQVFSGNTTSSSTAKTGKFRLKNGSFGDKYDGDSQSSTPSPGLGPGVLHKEISMDDVLDKIRRNRGDKQTWTEEKLRQLTKSR